MLTTLVMEPDIDRYHVTPFHLGEYAGLSISNSASFRRYLWERRHSELPTPLRAFHFLNVDVDSDAECRRVGELIRKHPIDAAFIGIGENCHLAFNDPPADFNAAKPFQVVGSTIFAECSSTRKGGSRRESASLGKLDTTFRPSQPVSVK